MSGWGWVEWVGSMPECVCGRAEGTPAWRPLPQPPYPTPPPTSKPLSQEEGLAEMTELAERPEVQEKLARRIASCTVKARALRGAAGGAWRGLLWWRLVRWRAAGLPGDAAVACFDRNLPIPTRRLVLFATARCSTRPAPARSCWWQTSTTRWVGGSGGWGSWQWGVTARWTRLLSSTTELRRPARLHPNLRRPAGRPATPPQPAQIFDLNSSAERPEELARPYLHQFFAAAYADYDIVIWSATSMKWVGE